MSTAAELRESLGQPVVETIAGRKVKIFTLRFEQLPEALELFAPVVQDAVGQVLDLGALLKGAGLIKEGERIRLDGATVMRFAVQLAPLLTTLPGALRAMQRVAQMCIDAEPEWVAQLEADQGLVLLRRVAEVNADFFTQKLLPMLKSSWSPRTGRSSSSPSVSAPGPASGPTPSSA